MQRARTHTRSVHVTGCSLALSQEASHDKPAAAEMSSGEKGGPSEGVFEPLPAARAHTCSPA